MAPELWWKNPAGEWVKVDSPEKAKPMHLERIKKKHEALEKEGFSCSQGWRMNVGTEHATLLDGGIRYAEQKGQGSLTIRDWGNVKHEGVPLEVARAILAEIVERQMSLLYGKWGLQERVEAAESFEELTSIQREYEGGW